MSKIDTIVDLGRKIKEAEALIKPYYKQLSDLKDSQKIDCEEKITGDLESKLRSSKITSGIYKDSIILPCENMKIKSSYSSGSYYDKSCTTYYVKCDVCGLYKEYYETYGGYG